MLPSDWDHGEVALSMLSVLLQVDLHFGVQFERDPTRCSAKCGQALQCGHICDACCGDCLKRQQALPDHDQEAAGAATHHMPCAQKCSRPLVCGHDCMRKCHPGSEPCSECSQKCPMLCAHGRCSLGCSKVCFGSCTDFQLFVAPECPPGPQKCMRSCLERQPGGYCK